MLAPRRTGSGGGTGLDSDNIRNLLQTTRAILNERSAAEHAPSFDDGIPRILPLPEYIYVWFSSNHKGAQSTGAMRGVMADAECGRFLDALERYREKSRELAAFWYLGEIKSIYPKSPCPVCLSLLWNMLCHSSSKGSSSRMKHANGFPRPPDPNCTESCACVHDSMALI